MFNRHVSTIYGMLHKLRPELFDTGNYYAQQRLKEIAKTQELEARRKDEVRLPNWLPETPPSLVSLPESEDVDEAAVPPLLPELSPLAFPAAPVPPSAEAPGAPSPELP